jgi:putative Mn2+ efflux pump MntP
MDFISLLNVLFIVIYAGILGLVAPYVGIKSDNYGSLVPTALGVISGSLLWILGTWVGLHYDQVDLANCDAGNAGRNLVWCKVHSEAS